MNGCSIADLSGSNPIVFKTDVNAATGPFTSGNEVMRITSAGNVGMGTVAPTERPDIGGGGPLHQRLLLGDVDRDADQVDARLARL